MSGPKVVEFKREGWRDAVTALKGIIEEIESGELAPVHIGVMVLMDRDGAAETFAFGPRADEVSALGLLRVGEKIILESSFEAE